MQKMIVILMTMKRLNLEDHLTTTSTGSGKFLQIFVQYFNVYP